MKKTIMFAILVSAALAVGCRRDKIIPDKELGEIFHDALLANSYVDYRNLDLDSLNIYEPIFERHGYTTDDVRHTIANFSRRKSARLSDVAEYMILLLDREARELNRQVTILDTIDNAARRFAARTLLADTMIRAATAADSSKLRFAIEPVPAGEYAVTARYTLDSLDKATGRRIRVEWVLPDSSRRLATSGTMQRGRGNIFSQTLTVGEADDYIGMEIDFTRAAEGGDRRARMTIEDLEVVYTPTTERSVELLFERQAGLRILSDTMINAIETRARETAAR